MSKSGSVSVIAQQRFLAFLEKNLSEILDKPFSELSQKHQLALFGNSDTPLSFQDMTIYDALMTKICRGAILGDSKPNGYEKMILDFIGRKSQIFEDKKDTDTDNGEVNLNEWLQKIESESKQDV